MGKGKQEDQRHTETTFHLKGVITSLYKTMFIFPCDSGSDVDVKLNIAKGIILLAVISYEY